MVMTSLPITVNQLSNLFREFRKMAFDPGWENCALSLEGTIENKINELGNEAIASANREAALKTDLHAAETKIVEAVTSLTALIDPTKLPPVEFNLSPGNEHNTEVGAENNRMILAFKTLLQQIIDQLKGQVIPASAAA